METTLRLQLPGPLVEIGPCVAVATCGDAEPGALAATEAIEAERQALALACRALDRAAAHLRGLQDDVLRDAETRLVDLAVEVARKVLCQEVQDGRYKIEPIVREALARAGPWREAVVHLHPEDLAEIEGVLRCEGRSDNSRDQGPGSGVQGPGIGDRELGSGVQGPGSAGQSEIRNATLRSTSPKSEMLSPLGTPHWGAVRLVADPALGRAECRVETAEGCVEARLDAALQHLCRTLKGMA
jgi:hypothetical protein